MATALLFFTLLLLLIPFFSMNMSHANPRVDVVARVCNNVEAQNASSYFKYYSKIIDYMDDEMSRNKFALKDAGNPPDRLYVLAQCMEDLVNVECSMCFMQIKTLVSGCFPYNGGRVYLDGCFIRFENYSFYREALSPTDTKRCSSQQNPEEGFRDQVRKVLDKVLKQAPKNKGFAVAQESSLDDISAYGMASCWKTLDNDLCSLCLSEAATSALSCLPSSEAWGLNAGCFLHHADTSFANNQKMDAKEALSYMAYVLVLLAVCLSAISTGVCVGKLTYRRMNRLRASKEMDEGLLLGESLQFLQFKYKTLETATKKFDESYRLGHGGYGEVYKGTLPDGREIAIKRLFISRKYRMKEICNEMDIISRAQHRNLVRFLGCCFTSVDSFLVYEYLANKSLDVMLFDPAKKKELDWKKRLQIITGTAEGLAYLHRDCQVRIIHRDVKASNVLLDLKYRPKISDFGLARFYSCDESLVNTAIAGTLGYIAPEYIAEGRLTEKVDVYSFGVLVLEIVTGVENNKYTSEEADETLVTAAWNHFQSDTVPEIIDASMEVENVKEIERVVQIGLLCAQESSSLRPTMREIVRMLRNNDVQLPMPSKPPFMDELMELHSICSNRRQRSLSDYSERHQEKQSRS